MSTTFARRAGVGVLILSALTTAVHAQQPVVNANWALSDKFSNSNLRPYIYTSTVAPRWIGKSDSMWYNWKDRNGSRFMLVVPATRTKQPLFDHARLAAALTTAHRKPVDRNNLPFTTVTFTEDHHSVRFMVDSLRYEWNLRTNTLKSLGRPSREELQRERAQAAQGGGGGGGGGQFGGGNNADFRNYSPDSTAYVYAMNHNLYLVETKGDTTPVQITRDGVEHYSFGWRDTTQVQQQDDDDEEEGGQRGGRNRDPRVRANVTWSPDSRAFVVPRNDSRKVKDLYLVNVLVDPRPKLSSYKYAMPGEENVAQQEVWTFTRGEKDVKRVKVDRWKDQRLFDLHFPVNAEKLRMVRRDRLQRNLELIEIDLKSGSTRQLLAESTENAYLERQNVRYVKSGGDFIWWSERSGWGHYYLYDHNGRLKHAITQGDWRAEQIVDVDSVRRVLWFRGVGRENGEDPYLRHLYRVPVDGGAIALLDAGEADHNSTLSPSKQFIVDPHSRIDLVPRSVVRDATGREIMELETMDVSQLREMGFRPPQKFVVKAADGVTDIYGNMWKPFDFDSTKKYPIIAHVYPGPQTEQVTTTFSPNAVQQRLAQLGFIVIQIGNRGGSPRRSNAYHSYGYYNLRDYGLADKKAGIEQLAARHGFIDVQRVGIYGHSGGGFMTAAALLQPPYNDFFKVGVSSAGNHDNNVYNQNWSEQHHGLKETRKPKQGVVASGNQDGSQTKASVDALDDSNFEIDFDIKVPANHELAENLKGRLLLVHGDMDNNVHPAGTIRLVNALIKANKRFDMMIMPGKAHGFADMQEYFTRMMFEYFTEHLLGDYYRVDATLKGQQ